MKEADTFKSGFVHRENRPYLSRPSKTIINNNDWVFHHIQYQLYCLCFLSHRSLHKRQARKKIHRTILRLRFKRATQSRLHALFRTNPNTPQTRVAKVTGVRLPALGTRRWKAGPFPALIFISLTVLMNACLNCEDLTLKNLLSHRLPRFRFLYK